MRRDGWTSWSALVAAAVLTAGCVTIDRVSTNAVGDGANGGSTAVAVSGSGRYVAFQSRASNLVSDVTNGQPHVFRKDRATGAVVNVDRRGTARAASATLGAISADGERVLFITSTPLVAADTNTVPDAYVRDVVAAPFDVFQGDVRTAVEVRGAEFLPGVVASITGGGVTVDSATPSADGRTLILEVSVAPDAAPFDYRDIIVSNVGGYGHADGRCIQCLKVLN